MQKQSKIIIAILLLCTFSFVGYRFISVPANKSDERVVQKRSSVVGEWVLNEMYYREEIKGYDELVSMYGGEFIYDFISSNVVKVGVGESKKECNYEQKGALVTIKYEDKVSTLTMLDNENMIIDNADVQLKLIRR